MAIRIIMFMLMAMSVGLSVASADTLYFVQVDTQRLALGDPNVLLETLHEENAATSLLLEGPTIVGAFGASASAFASADLASGTLKVAGSALRGHEGSPTANVAGAGFLDTLTFSLPDDVASIEVRFAMAIDGTFSASPGSCTGFASVALAGETVWAPSMSGAGDCADVLGRTLSGHATIYASDPTVTFFAGLNLGLTFDGSFDAFHTAAVSLDLPAGTTYTSASGVFLTEPSNPTPVPEPATVLLTTTGLIASAFRHRRRRRR